jgi:hypothetical protein
MGFFITRISRNQCNTHITYLFDDDDLKVVIQLSGRFVYPDDFAGDQSVRINKARLYSGLDINICPVPRIKIRKKKCTSEYCWALVRLYKYLFDVWIL